MERYQGMPETRIRAIIFDIGRVLVRVDIRRLQDSLAQGLSLTPEVSGRPSKKIPYGAIGKKAASPLTIGISISANAWAFL